jgi:hypothetical protein
MLNLNTKRHGRAAVLKLASAAMAAALACGSVWAQTSKASTGALTVQLVSVKLADLENAFWTCEYAATTRGNANIENCAAIYAALKTRKFDGDFDGLLQWWQQNREAVYRRLSASEVSLSGER